MEKNLISEISYIFCINKNQISCALVEEMRTKRRKYHRSKAEINSKIGVHICDKLNWLWNDKKTISQISKFDPLKKAKHPHTQSRGSAIGFATERNTIPEQFLAKNIDENIKGVISATTDFREYAKDPYIKREFNNHFKSMEMIYNKSYNSEYYDLKLKQQEYDRLQSVLKDFENKAKIDNAVFEKRDQLK